MSEEPRGEECVEPRSLAHRMFRFAAVGASGVVVNLGVFTLLRGVGELVFAPAIAFQVAVALGILVSIGTNFYLNDRWTWNDLSPSSAVSSGWSRFWKFYAVALLAGAINFAVARYLQSFALKSEYFAVLSGIACATAVNFMVNHGWTFRAKPEQTS